MSSTENSPSQAKKRRLTKATACEIERQSKDTRRRADEKVATVPASGASPTCDKCDERHKTEACPHFTKIREQHKDAWASYGTKVPTVLGTKGRNFVLKGARMIRQPGDGSCLFHSLCHGLNGSKDGRRAKALRREIASFVKENPQLKIAGDTLEEWVRWDARTSCATYARRMALGGWGGGIEMAACARLKKVNVHVYEPGKTGKFQRISCFNYPRDAKMKKTINVLYQGRMHYDALLVTS